jgi:hypothetical protein
MTDETTDSTTEQKVEKAALPSIGDFATGYTNRATYLNGVIVLAHSGDGVTLSLKAPYTKLVIRHRQTERINRSTTAIIGGQPSGKEEVPHEDNLYTLDAANASKTIINTNEKTVTTDKYDVTFYDFNHYLTLDGAWTAAGKVDVAAATPPPPPKDEGKDGGGIPWMWIAVAVVAIIAVGLVIYAVTRRPSVAAIPAAPVASAGVGIW